MQIIRHTFFLNNAFETKTQIQFYYSSQITRSNNDTILVPLWTPEDGKSFRFGGIHLNTSLFKFCVFGHKIKNLTKISNYHLNDLQISYRFWDKSILWVFKIVTFVVYGHFYQVLRHNPDIWLSTQIGYNILLKNCCLLPVSL